MKLKPCPFCGSNPSLVYGDYNTTSVRCSRCGVEGNRYFEIGKTAEMWNKRTESAEIASLKSELERVTKERDAAIKGTIHTVHNCKHGSGCNLASKNHWDCWSCTKWEWRGIEPPKGE